MDKEQAIDLLDNLIGMIEDNQDNDYDTAFRMAIEALKAQLSQEGTTSDQHVATDTNVGNNSEIPNSWDCVSRQQAIDIVVFECGKWTGLAKEISKQLKQLPPAQPERQKGEWIDYTEDGYVECPFCHSATNCDGNKDELHYCFSCGADMRGEQNETD